MGGEAGRSFRREERERGGDMEKRDTRACERHPELRNLNKERFATVQGFRAFIVSQLHGLPR